MPSARKGFTLIELLVVISIVAILAAIGLITYSGVQKTARDSKRISDIQEIQKALEQYYSINGSVYPTDAQYAATSGAGAFNTSAYFPGSTMPVDPENSSAYLYKSCASPQKYLLCSKNIEIDGNVNYSVTPFPTDGCGGFVKASGSVGSTTYYCVSSIAN